MLRGSDGARVIKFFQVELKYIIVIFQIPDEEETNGYGRRFYYTRIFTFAVF